MRKKPMLSRPELTRNLLVLALLVVGCGGEVPAEPDAGGNGVRCPSPDAVETCNGLDDDCDGKIDEDLGATSCGQGTCAVTVQNCVDGVAQTCTPGSPAPEESCNGLDDDCDGENDEGLGSTTCGEGACAVTVEACLSGMTPACVPDVPAPAESCNGVDDDCDGQIDEDLGSTTCGVGACAATVPNCVDGVPQTCAPGAPAGAESCNSLDDDCDGQTDEDLGSTSCGVGACASTVQNCVNGSSQTCAPGTPAGAESCNGLDDDCDGQTDETCLSGDTCDTAISLPANGTSNGDSSSFNNDYGSGTNCAGTSGREVVYALDVPPGHRSTVSVTTGDGSFDPSISLGTRSAACVSTGRVCITGDDSGTASTVNEANYLNQGATTESLVVFVDSYSSTRSGPFVINAATAPIPQGDTCAGADAVLSSPLNGTTTGYWRDYPSGTSCAASSAPERVYRIDLPADKRLTASVLGTSPFNAGISLGRLASACVPSSRTCLAGADSSTQTTTDTVTYSNRTGTTEDIYIFIGSGSSTATGDFTLTTAIDDAPALIAGEVCQNAESITAGTINGTTVGYANDYGSGSGCSGVSGADRLYRISVPAGQRLTATVTPVSSWDPSINLMLSAGCGSPRVCVDGNDDGATGEPDTVSYTNTGASAVDVLVAVESYSSSQSGAFTLTTALDIP
jgi:hypothetical protein